MTTKPLVHLVNFTTEKTFCDREICPGTELALATIEHQQNGSTVLGIDDVTCPDCIKAFTERLLAAMSEAAEGRMW